MNVPDEVKVAAERDTFDMKKVRSWLHEEFRRQQSTSENIGDSERVLEFLKWLNSNLYEGNDLDFLLNKTPALGKSIYNSFSDKYNWVKQRKCQICDGDGRTDELFPIWNIPIRITPTTWQSSKKEQKKAFRDAVVTYISAKKPEGMDKARKYCVALTFVLNESSRDKDCDNMAKGLMDSFCAAIAIDDRQVQHLDIVKLFFPDCEDHISLRIAPSRLNGHGDVLVKMTNMIFNVGDRIG